MQRNIHDHLDRVLRIVIGLLTLSLVLLGDGSNRWLGLVGLLPILSAIYAWCPAYAWLERSGRLGKRGT
jgi:hypothetical protein